jgi:hypothetical protein
MRICRHVPSDGFPEVLQPLVVAEQGVGCNSATVFMTHGATDFPIPSAINLSVSKASVPGHIGLVLVLTPILLTNAGPVLINDMLPLLPQHFHRNSLCGRDDLSDRDCFDHIVQTSRQESLESLPHLTPCDLSGSNWGLSNSLVASISWGIPSNIDSKVISGVLSNITG